ncbi:MAG TPA: PaaI family thioesterase [Candidatus Tyrphobacter sp.]
MSDAGVPVDDGYCFACGPHNPIGMHLDFENLGPRGVRAQTTLAPEFQGWRGIAHGGIAISLLDEAMAHAAGYAGYRGVTASMTIRFRKPVPLGEPISIVGRVAWVRAKVLGVEAEVRDARDTVLLRGEGHFVSWGAVGDAVDRRNPKL